MSRGLQLHGAVAFDTELVRVTDKIRNDASFASGRRSSA